MQLPMRITALAAALASVLVVLSSAGAQSLPPVSEQPPDQVLLASSLALQMGYAQQTEAPESRPTGLKECPDAYRESFENANASGAIVTQLTLCATAKDARRLLNLTTSGGKRIRGDTAPGGLGRNSVERAGSPFSYLIFWQRGPVVALAALDTSLAMPTKTSMKLFAASLEVPALPPSDQRLLAEIALGQDARIVGLGPGGG